ncbi:MAG TPA: ACP S-malonyltransferase [Thermoanaerobaculia bacterium]|nr:ACP S-malonyltransferase [Thermoanaerobaculia bacterium]
MTASAAFLFPGQLAEWVGMGKDFFEADPEARSLVAATSRACGRDLERILFEGPDVELHENLAAQAGVCLVSTLAARALLRAGVAPRATAGYSLGNYAAMVAAGAIGYDEALEVLVAVWRETERLGIRGAMGAVIGARREVVESVLDALRARGRCVWIGNVNASTQFVLTGEKESVAEALDELKPRALSVLPLAMSWPIHSELMRPVADAIAPLVAGLKTVKDPDSAYYGPEGRPVSGGAEVRRLLGTAFCFPTLWKDTFERLVADGARVFLEVGPGEMLSKMVRWIDRTTRCQPVGTLAAVRAAVDIVHRP